MELRSFGIEIRKTGNIKNILADVDAFLNKKGIMPNNVGIKVQAVAAAHALNKMFKVERYFDVCTVRDCSEMCQVVISKERMLLYRSAHCMHWNEMDHEYRQTLIAMVIDDFRSILEGI